MTHDVATGLKWYLAFLFSTTVHEAAHAWTAITTLLATVADALPETEWTEHGVLVKGVKGLRLRRSDDETWTEGAASARAFWARYGV